MTLGIYIYRHYATHACLHTHTIEHTWTYTETHHPSMCCLALKASAVDKTATVDSAPLLDLYSSLYTPLEMSADVHS